MKDLMAALNKAKVSDLFSEVLIPDGEGDQMVDRDTFLDKIKADMLYTEDEAQNILKAALSDKDESKVSMRKLEDLLVKPMVAPAKAPLSLDKAKEILNQTFEHLKRFIAMNEVNLVDIFYGNEGDGRLNREELSRALLKCRFETTGVEYEERMEAIYMLYDRKKELKIDCMSFLQDFYQKAN